MTDSRTTEPTHPEEQDTTAMTPANNTAAQSDEAAIETPAAGLRLVAEGETAPTKEELIERHAGLVVENERAAAELKAEAAKYTALADSHKAELVKLFPGKGKYPVGDLVVSVTEPSRSFDSAAFLKAYPVEVNPALYKSVINTEAVPPNLKNQFMAPGTGERKVAVK